jgi:predicted nucleic acid-binding protein
VTAKTVSERVLVDSSGWLEYLTADTKRALFEPYLLDKKKILIVPTIVMYEVRKVLLVQQQKNAADWFTSEAMRHTVVPLDETIASSAATNSVQMKMPMADAIIYTTALVENAKIVTSDRHFNNIPNALVL